METIKENNTKEIGKEILGGWKLLEWVYTDNNGVEVHYFGPNPQGLLTYLEAGYMAVQVANAQREDFDIKVFDAGSEREQADAFGSYIAFYGKYKEVRPAVFEHYLESSLFPNWRGDVQTRYAKLDGDILVLTTPPVPTKNGDIIFKLTWRKVL